MVRLFLEKYLTSFMVDCSLYHFSNLAAYILVSSSIDCFANSDDTEIEYVIIGC